MSAEDSATRNKAEGYLLSLACDTKIHLDVTFAFLASCCWLGFHFWFTVTPISQSFLWRCCIEIILRVILSWNVPPLLLLICLLGQLTCQKKVN